MGKCLFMRKGEVHTVPVVRTPLGEIAVGSIVKMKVNDTLTEFVVVHQGNPSGSYTSCDGTWLLMKDAYESMAFESISSNTLYYNSSINTYLNGTFLNLIDSDISTHLITGKLPRQTSATGSIQTGVWETTVFLLSAIEHGFTSSDNSQVTNEGSCLEYFADHTNAKRVAYYNGTAVACWMRTPSNNVGYMTVCATNGGFSHQFYSTANYIRPALILDSTVLVNDEGIIKGVS